MQQSWIPYCGAAPLPSDWLARWNGDPVLIAILAIVATLGWRWAANRALFVSAVLLMAVTFLSPLCSLTSALFSARVVHHVILTAIVAPIVVAAISYRAWRGLAGWTAAQILVFWAWHAPPAYAAALSSDAIFWLMQASLLGSAIGFWGAIRGSPAPAAVVALLATMVAMGLLGALITLAAVPLYAPHFVAPIAWGLTPLDDQQLAGVIMWAPAAALYLAAALAIAWRTIGADRRVVPA